jgi:hypothetical protein
MTYTKRLYLPSSGSSPLLSLAVAAYWEGSVSTFFRAPTLETKQDTALTDFAARFNSTASRDDCWAQWVSPPLAGAYEFVGASDVCSLVVRGLEANAQCDAYLAWSLRILSGDGGTERGLLNDGSAGTEFTTSALTRRLNSNTLENTVAAQAGDRIVIEMGCHGTTPSTAYDVTLRFGDPSATEDFACTDNLTTDLCPWVEFVTASELTFAAEGGGAVFLPQIMSHHFIPSLIGGH